MCDQCGQDECIDIIRTGSKLGNLHSSDFLADAVPKFQRTTSCRSNWDVAMSASRLFSCAIFSKYFIEATRTKFRVSFVSSSCHRWGEENVYAYIQGLQWGDYTDIWRSTCQKDSLSTDLAGLRRLAAPHREMWRRCCEIDKSCFPAPRFQSFIIFTKYVAPGRDMNKLFMRHFQGVHNFLCHSSGSKDIEKSPCYMCWTCAQKWLELLASISTKQSVNFLILAILSPYLFWEGTCL